MVGINPILSIITLKGNVIKNYLEDWDCHTEHKARPDYCYLQEITLNKKIDVKSKRMKKYIM